MTPKDIFTIIRLGKKKGGGGEGEEAGEVCKGTLYYRKTALLHVHNSDCLRRKGSISHKMLKGLHGT